MLTTAFYGPRDTCRAQQKPRAARTEILTDLLASATSFSASLADYRALLNGAAAKYPQPSNTIMPCLRHAALSGDLGSHQLLPRQRIGDCGDSGGGARLDVFASTHGGRRPRPRARTRPAVRRGRTRAVFAKAGSRRDAHAVGHSNSICVLPSGDLCRQRQFARRCGRRFTVWRGLRRGRANGRHPRRPSTAPAPSNSNGWSEGRQRGDFPGSLRVAVMVYVSAVRGRLAGQRAQREDVAR